MFQKQVVPNAKGTYSVVAPSLILTYSYSYESLRHLKGKAVGGKKAVLGARAFSAITAVEGLALGEEARLRLSRLQADKSLTPDERRAAVLRAYSASNRGK
jgi:hypothetical protein